MTCQVYKAEHLRFSPGLDVSEAHVVLLFYCAVKINVCGKKYTRSKASPATQKGSGRGPMAALNGDFLKTGTDSGSSPGSDVNEKGRSNNRLTKSL